MTRTAANGKRRLSPRTIARLRQRRQGALDGARDVATAILYLQCSHEHRVYLLDQFYQTTYDERSSPLIERMAHREVFDYYLDVATIEDASSLVFDSRV